MQTKILIWLFVCHWIADYTWLSTSTMLAAKRFGKPLCPIFNHSCVHACLMAIPLTIFIGYKILVPYLLLFQIGTHFLIDVWKGRMNGWFPKLQSPANKWHWVVFGFDQLLHALVIITMSVYAA